MFDRYIDLSVALRRGFVCAVEAEQADHHIQVAPLPCPLLKWLRLPIAVLLDGTPETLRSDLPLSGPAFRRAIRSAGSSAPRAVTSSTSRPTASCRRVRPDESPERAMLPTLRIYASTAEWSVIPPPSCCCCVTGKTAQRCSVDSLGSRVLFTLPIPAFTIDRSLCSRRSDLGIHDRPKHAPGKERPRRRQIWHP